MLVFLCTLFGSPATLAKLLEQSVVLRAGRAKLIPTLIVLMPSTGEVQEEWHYCGAMVQRALRLGVAGLPVAASRGAVVFAWCLLSVAEMQCGICIHIRSSHLALPPRCGARDDTRLH